MIFLALDVGTYSVKAVEFRIDRKRVHIVNHQEFLLSKVREQFGQDFTIEEIQQEVIKLVLAKYNDISKLIFQVPIDFVTSRNFILPVLNKKKAQQMLPYQLEDNYYLSAEKVHFIYHFFQRKDSFHALVFLTTDKDFYSYHSMLESKHILPHNLCSEQTAIQDFVLNEEMNGHFCILDIGHTTTKAYFFQNQEMISFHVLYFGGADITEVISKTYDISPDDAHVYKHENCYFLLEEQYESVTEDQMEFARMMKKTFSPLIKEYQKWEIGGQTKTGDNPSKIYLTGGTSKIKNISPFLAYNLGVKIEFLQISKHIKNPRNFKDEEIPIFNTSSIFASIQVAKKQPFNLLSGKYSSLKGGILPLHSMAFVFSRVCIICLILITSFIIDKSINSVELKKVKTNVINLLGKANYLQNTGKGKLTQLANNDRAELIKILKNQKNDIDKSIDYFSGKQERQATKALALVSTILNNQKDVTVEKLKGGGNYVEFTAVAKNETAYKDLVAHLEKYPGKGLTIEKKAGQKTVFATTDF